MNKEPFVEAILTVLRDMVREEVRAAIRPEPQEGPWRVEGGDVRSTLTNDDLSYWIEEPKIEALTLAALLNRGAAAERRVAELEAERKQPHGICAEPPYQRRLREERDDLRKRLESAEVELGISEGDAKYATYNTIDSLFTQVRKLEAERDTLHQQLRELAGLAARDRCFDCNREKGGSLE